VTSERFDFDVVGMGLNAVDHICVVPRFPQYEEKLRMQDFRRTVGGQVASALVACRRWGLRVKYIGKIGDDEMGEFSYRSLEAEGLDLEHVKQVKGAQNQFAFILVDATNGERTIIWKRDERLAIKAEEVPLDAIASGRFLLLDGHDAQAAAVAAREARKHGVTIVLDAETVKNGTAELVSSSHYVVCSREFPRTFTGEEDLEKAMGVIIARGPSCVCVTLGRDGAICLWQGDILRVKGFKVKCVDSTGAGDVFHGGFIYGLSRGWHIGKVLDFANAAAALNCTRIGARGGIAKVDEIVDMIEKGQRW